jgi:hypothetical protein
MKTNTYTVFKPYVPLLFLCIYIYYNNGMFSHNKVTILRSFTQSHTIKVITKLPNSEQSYNHIQFNVKAAREYILVHLRRFC